MLLHLFFRDLNKVASNRITHTARATVQHNPNAIIKIKADLYKVIARPERPKMLIIIGLNKARIFIGERFKTGLKFCPIAIDDFRRFIPRAHIFFPLPITASAVGNCCFKRDA